MLDCRGLYKIFNTLIFVSHFQLIENAWAIILNFNFIAKTHTNAEKKTFAANGSQGSFTEIFKNEYEMHIFDKNTILFNRNYRPLHCFHCY